MLDHRTGQRYRLSVRAVPLVVVAVLAVPLGRVVVRRVRLARRGQEVPTGRALGLTLTIIGWIVALGFAIGYLAAHTLLAGGIGAAAAFVAIPMVAPILRIREEGIRGGG